MEVVFEGGEIYSEEGQVQSKFDLNLAPGEDYLVLLRQTEGVCKFRFNYQGIQASYV